MRDQLLELFERLAPEDRGALLAFAEFLAQRRPPRVEQASQAPASAPPSPQPLAEPEPIARPQSESVVKAVKRLSRTYPMLDRQSMLDETSSLVAQHVIGRREAKEVIDELEEVFARHYRELKSQRDQTQE